MQIALPTALAFLVISASPTLYTNGFSSLTPLTQSHAGLTRHPHRPSSLHVFFGDDNSLDGYGDEDDDEDNMNGRFDLENARERLEELVGSQELQETFFEEMKMRTVERPTVRSPTYRPSPLPALDVALPPAPPLTTIERERREAEIQLLGRLTEGDESVSDLWTLWFGERGSESAQKLLKAEELTNDGPQSWARAEDILRALIEEHGVYWVEPVNRLATLYYMQGRLDEAETLNKVVLAVKPWHFGALSGIVMIYAAQADSEKARLWAASRLPTFAPTGANRRRIAWAEKAVQSAEESLENAEKRIQDLFGAPDDYSAMQHKDDWDTNEDAAWQ